MEMKKKIMTGLLCCALCFNTALSAYAVEDEDTGKQQEKQDTVSMIDASDVSNGADSDVALSGVKITGNQVGKNVQIHFNANTGVAGKQYTVDRILQVMPVVDSTFPFETSDDAYKITTGSGKSLACSYSFTAKDDLETGYYPVTFQVVYERTNSGITAGNNNYYNVIKTINVKLKKRAEQSQEAVDDIIMAVANTPSGTYGKNMAMQFTVTSKKNKITRVIPVIDGSFPFETKGDAYKAITSKGTSKLKCNYQFKVRKDIATGYQPVSFEITYKNGKTIGTSTKTINADLTGKKDEKVNGSNGKQSTPQIIVSDYSIKEESVVVGNKFTLQLTMKNTSHKNIQNYKLSISNEDGNILPAQGSGTQYLELFPAESEHVFTYIMKAAKGLEEKSYKLAVKSEYEDAKANSYTAEDSVFIPVKLKQRVSVTDLIADGVKLGEDVEIIAQVNNMGDGMLYNVVANADGDNIAAQSTYLGNIEAGKSANLDMLAKTIKVYEKTQNDKNKLTISYEDSEGNTLEETKDLSLSVEGSVYSNLTKIKETKKKAFPVKTVVIIVIVVAICGGIGYLIIRRHKKKKAMLEDF